MWWLHYGQAQFNYYIIIFEGIKANFTKNVENLTTPCMLAIIQGKFHPFKRFLQNFDLEFWNKLEVISFK